MMDIAELSKPLISFHLLCRRGPKIRVSAKRIGETVSATKANCQSIRVVT